MTSNVEPEEAEALQELLEPADGAAERSVAERDFRRPMRLSRSQLGEVREAMQLGVGELEGAVRSFFGSRAVCELADVTEANAEAAVASLAPPFAVGRFTLGGQPAWIVWPVAPALAAVGTVFGEDPSSAESAEPRPPTGVERRLLRDFYTGVVDVMLAPLDLKAGPVELVSESHELGSWRDGDPAGADLHRLCVSIALEGVAPRSTLHLYLPGFQPNQASSNKDAPSLPSHLAPVEIRVRALLGTSAIPLAELMQIEEGDVIPLDVAAGGPLTLTVEDNPCARGRLGRRNGRYAFRIEEILELPLPNEKTP